MVLRYQQKQSNFKKDLENKLKELEGEAVRLALTDKADKKHDIAAKNIQREIEDIRLLLNMVNNPENGEK